MSMNIRGGIYIASKTVHAPKWRAYREAGFPVISTWIDEAGEGESKSFTDLWLRIVREASQCACLIIYREPGEVWTGALVEVGCALGAGRLVLGCGDWDDVKPNTFHNHPLFQFVPNVNIAFATGMRAAAKFAAIDARERNASLLSSTTKQ